MSHRSSHIFAQASFWLEPAASTSAQQHDRVFYTVLYVTGFFFVLVVALMLLFIVLYRRRKGALPEPGPTHNTPLEIVWTGIPLVVVIVLFVMGLRAFLDFDTPPSDAEVIDVEARQWAFTFTYPNGATSEQLYLRDRPAGDPPASFGRRAARALHPRLSRPAQRRAGPNRRRCGSSRCELGSYHAFCTQYCGNGHSLMTTEVVVLDATGYAAKLAELANIFVDPATKKPLPYAKVGQRLYKTSGCAQCHSVGRLARHGADLAGALQERRAVLGGAAGLHALGRRRRRQVGRLPPRVDPRSRREDRPGLPERHAALRRPVQRHAPTRTRNSRPSSNTSRASTTTGRAASGSIERPSPRQRTPATDRKCAKKSHGRMEPMLIRESP